ncbi:HAD family hydrolase [Vulcanisaeta thermophila]|uniref:HAD family hydrolase n=1 Tax=Vulcanisaeta thermophila TaxID=867917 RepID=UPI0008539ECF|nr:HAD family hydrolase [Vulcanisaeta thermophila]
MGRHMPIRCILFDFDDTLVDSEPARQAARWAVALTLSRTYGIDVNHVLRVITDVERSMEARGVYDRSEWWRAVARILGIELRGIEGQLTTMYWRQWIMNTRPFPDTEEALTTLSRHGLTLGVIANDDGIPGHKRDRIVNSGIPTNTLKLILVAGDDTERRKPDPQPFRKALETLGMEPWECAYVGDKPHDDVPGARAIGMWTVIIARRQVPVFGVNMEKPHMVIGTLKQLINTIRHTNT